MSTDTPDERRTRPFSDFLAEHNNGQGHRQAGEELQRLVAAVVETGKKGSLTIKVDVEPMKNADEGTLLTKVTVASKLPTVEPKAAIFYADDDDNLTRTDPNQLSFDALREAPAPVVKDAPAAPVVKVVGE